MNLIMNEPAQLLKLPQLIEQSFAGVNKQSPLVVNITNYVVMNNTANALLAIGASPIMAHCQQEMADLLSVANALVINMGTLDSVWIACMKHAISLAVEMGKPVVIDPVGCGASRLRADTARQLCELAAPLRQHFTLRCNGSEVMALIGKNLTNKGRDNKGVDSLICSDRSKEILIAAKQMRTRFGCDVVVSGEIDYVVGERCFALHQGSEMMRRVTGMGCTLSALTAAFAGLESRLEQPHTKASPGLIATALMGVAGKLAAAKSQGPGSFQLHLLDTLYQLTQQASSTKQSVIKHLIFNEC